MNARILLEERPPRRAANLTQEGECDEHAEKESSRDVGGAAVIGSHRCGLSIGRFCGGAAGCQLAFRSEEHTSELQSLMRISYAVFCLIKQNETNIIPIYYRHYS